MAYTKPETATNSIAKVGEQLRTPPAPKKAEPVKASTHRMAGSHDGLYVTEHHRLRKK